MGGWELLSLDGVRSNWKTWKYLWDGGDFKGLEAAPAAGVVSSWWESTWIPLTANYCGDHHCLDLTTTAASSRTGQIISLLHDDPRRQVVAPGFENWLTGFADDLERGAYTYSDECGELVKTDGDSSS